MHGAAARLSEEEMPRWGCKGEIMKYHCIIFSEMLHELRRQPAEGAHRKPWSTVAASRGKSGQDVAARLSHSICFSENFPLGNSEK